MRKLIFIPVFFAFYILIKSFGIPDLGLVHFAGRPVSLATSEGIDIAARVSVFYKALLFLVFLLIALSRLAIIAARFISAEELKLMNGLSLAGFCLLFFRVIGAEMRPSHHIIFALLGILATGSIFHQVRSRKHSNYTIAFLWSSIAAACIFFLQWQLSRLTGFGKFISLPVTLITAGSALYLYVTTSYQVNFRLLRSTFALVFIPLLSFLSMELVMILNQRGLFISQSTVYLAGLILIAVYISYAWNKFKGIHSGINHEIIIFRTWMPWLLSGILCIAFYSPIVTAEVDIFESANNILPIQQWFKFGKVPLLDSFNAHSLADFSPGWLYSALNGYNPMGYFVYRSLITVAGLLLIYLMIYKISGNGFLALWITIAYPYTEHLLPSYFNLVPLPVILFIRLYEKQSVSRYLQYFLSLAFLVLWRIDLGVSVLIAGFISFLVILYASPSFSLNRRKFFTALFYTAGLLCIAFALAFLHSGSTLFTAMRDILNYLSSAQSYGVRDLSGILDMEYYSLYFILPAVVVMIVAAVIYNLRNASISGERVFIALVIVFLGIFYLSNFQRGLVRHTLYEHWNAALTSYGFFIVAIYVYLLQYKHESENRFLVFFIASTLLVSNYVYGKPELNMNNNYFLMAEKINSPPVNVKKEKAGRINEIPHPSIHNEFRVWLDSKYPKSTFADFSNSPMLYYYANRNVPSYFVQSPHTAHNEYLQKRYIADLRNYDIPVLVFSNVPQNFWDNLDGIPNAYRHYRIAEYFYREYRPAYIMDDHAIWVRKSIPVHEEKVLYEYKYDSQQHEQQDIKNGEATKSSAHAFAVDIPQYNGKLYAIMSFNAVNPGALSVYYNSDNKREFREIKLAFAPGENNLPVYFESEFGDQINDIKYRVENDAIINFHSIKFYSDEYFADHVSSQPAFYQLKWIPYIWGTYDQTAMESDDKAVRTLIHEEQKIPKDTKLQFEFQPVNEKSDGNYLKLSVRCLAKQTAALTIQYGMPGKTNGSFNFAVKNDSIYHDYLLRISSQYGWYANENNNVTVIPSEDIRIRSANILRGD